MDQNGEKDAGGSSDGQTVTESESSDDKIITSTDSEVKDNTAVGCAHDESSSKDGQTVTSVENDDNSRATVKSSDDDKNVQKVSSTEDSGNNDQIGVTNIEKGKNIIEKAEIANRENKKEEALELYKRGIELLIQGLKVTVEPLTDEEKNSLKLKIAGYLSLAEKLKKELDPSDISVNPEDKHIVDYVNDMIKSSPSNTTLDDVCGCQDAKDCLKESIILPSMFPQLFSGRRMPWRGILLFGAPGTGKTMIARAVAGQCPDIGFIHIAACDLISKYIGEPEKIVRCLFEKAAELKNNLLFIDDFDLLSDTSTENVRKVRIELIVQFHEHKNVRLLVASNQPWVIDPFHRKRLEKRIYIRMPEKEARKQIVCKNLESVKNDMTDEDLDELAEKMEGYTGSDIVCLVRDAMMEHIREIQKATHFRQVKNNSSKTAEDDFQYHVCTADDPDSIPMTLDDFLLLEPDQLFSRPLHKDDLVKCLSRSKPTVDKEYLKKLNSFAEDFT